MIVVSFCVFSTDCSDRLLDDRPWPFHLLTVAELLRGQLFHFLEHKLVVGSAQILKVIFFKADESPQVGLTCQCAAEAIHHMLPILFLFDE